MECGQPKRRVLLLLLLFIVIPSQTSASDLQESNEQGHGQDYWNLTSEPVLGESQMQSNLVNYSDVAILVNNQSPTSREIAAAFITARNISSDRVFRFTALETPSSETISLGQFETYYLEPLEQMLGDRNLTMEINYLVTTKGIPLRVNGGTNARSSFDSEIGLAGTSWRTAIGQDYWIDHNYGPLAGEEWKPFTRAEQGFYLVSRLTAYDRETAMALIDKASNSLGQRGTAVLDLATNRNDSGYKSWNDMLYAADNALSSEHGIPVFFNQNETFETNHSDVMMYASWGSNDGAWNKNWLPNSGFDIIDAGYSSGVKYWNASSPPISLNESFKWAHQDTKKYNGNGAMEASLSASCSQKRGIGTQGILAEYFDNEGLIFNTGSMPSLIERAPDYVRLESDLAYGSSSSSYPGLDDRFKNDWGGRFSGLINIPESGNWTFYLRTDDGSELWVDDLSIVTNYGSHGMVEKTGSISLNAGLHDFRIEFFQGGGPHGLQFSWEGPNHPKTYVPSSAFYVSGDYIPSKDTLRHRWSFEEGGGSEANDSSSNNASLILKNMDTSNWKNCVDGGCLWFDGTNDYAEVEIDDWTGNFTVSQWVWANASIQPDYASTFASSNNAGSNTSFQHAIYGGEWQLQNHHSGGFGMVQPEQWVHLVTVFNQGTVHQYLDGIRVNTTTYPTNSFNTFELYKIGVNRGGSVHFEGMIDEVIVWESALSAGEVTALHRAIYKECFSYSTSGQKVAYIEQLYPIPADLKDHVWVTYAHGAREGAIYGSFTIEVKGLDQYGNIISTNESSKRTLKESWGTSVMRFRPHENAVNLRIRVHLDIAPNSINGSYFIDNVVLRAIQPHMNWVNGSIAETAVSTGGRSFVWGTSYGQSLIADLLEDGVSSAKGYVYEPYIGAIGHPDQLFSAYSMGLGAAESHYAANRMLSWMGTVIGDPKMAPYLDRIEDLRIIDGRNLDYISTESGGIVEILIENHGLGSWKGNITVLDRIENQVLDSTQVEVLASTEIGSRTILQFSLPALREGAVDILIEAISEREGHRIARPTSIEEYQWTIYVDAPPEEPSLNCQSLTLLAGEATTCEVWASDELGLESAYLIWWPRTSQSTPTRSNASWINGMLIIEVNTSKEIQLGHIDGQLTVFDLAGHRNETGIASLIEIVDAPARWFGPHLEGYDRDNWDGMGPPESGGPIPLTSGSIYNTSVCIYDADGLGSIQPPFIEIGNEQWGTEIIENENPFLDCYRTKIDLIGISPREILVKVVSKEGIIFASRTLSIIDRPAWINTDVVGTNGESTAKIEFKNEMIRIEVGDQDGTLLSGDAVIKITWPTGEVEVFSAKVDSSRRHDIPIPIPKSGLRSGDVVIEIDVALMDGTILESKEDVTLSLRRPIIHFISICQDGEEVELINVERNYIIISEILSSRPIEKTMIHLSSLGEVVGTGPNSQEALDCVNNSSAEMWSYRIPAGLPLLEDLKTQELEIEAIDVDQRRGKLSIEIGIGDFSPINIELISSKQNIGSKTFLHVEIYVGLDLPDNDSCQYDIIKNNSIEHNDTLIINDEGKSSIDYLLIQSDNEIYISVYCKKNGRVGLQTIGPFADDAEERDKSEVKEKDVSILLGKERTRIVIVGSSVLLIISCISILWMIRGSRNKVSPWPNENLDDDLYAADILFGTDKT